MHMEAEIYSADRICSRMSKTTAPTVPTAPTGLWHATVDPVGAVVFWLPNANPVGAVDAVFEVQLQIL